MGKKKRKRRARRRVNVEPSVKLLKAGTNATTQLALTGAVTNLIKGL